MPTKPWYASLTIWSAVATLVCAGLTALHVNLPDSAQTDLSGWLLATATFVSGGVSIYGRWRATKQIAPIDGEKDEPLHLNSLVALAMLPLAALATLTLGGCASSTAGTASTQPSAALKADAIAWDTYNAASAVATTLRQNGKIGDAQWAKIETGFSIAEAALKDYDAIIATDSTGAAKDLAVASSTMELLQEIMNASN